MGAHVPRQVCDLCAWPCVSYCLGRSLNNNAANTEHHIFAFHPPCRAVFVMRLTSTDTTSIFYKKVSVLMDLLFTT